MELNTDNKDLLRGCLVLVRRRHGHVLQTDQSINFWLKQSLIIILQIQAMSNRRQFRHSGTLFLYFAYFAKPATAWKQRYVYSVSCHKLSMSQLSVNRTHKQRNNRAQNKMWTRDVSYPLCCRTVPVFPVCRNVGKDGRQNPNCCSTQCPQRSSKLESTADTINQNSCTP